MNKDYETMWVELKRRILFNKEQYELEKEHGKHHYEELPHLQEVELLYETIASDIKHLESLFFIKK